MPIDNEQLKSVIGIPDPKADPDNETLRAVAGLPSFGEDDTPSTAPPARPGLSIGIGLGIGL